MLACTLNSTEPVFVRSKAPGTPSPKSNEFYFLCDEVACWPLGHAQKVFVLCAFLKETC